MRKSLASALVLFGGFVAIGCGSSTPDSTTSGLGGSGVGGSGVGGSGVGGSGVGSSGVGGSGVGGSGVGGSGGTGGTATSSATGGSGTSSGGNGTGGNASTASGGKSAGGSNNTGGVTSPSGGSQTVGGGTSAGGTSASKGGSPTGGATISSGGSTGVGGTAGGASAGGAGGASGAAPTGGTAGGGPDVCTTPPESATGASDAVVGTLITFNDNGGWCWYQDERASVDTKGNKIVIGSVAFGGSRNGNIEAVIYDLATKKANAPAKIGNLSVDDHNAPAFAIRPDGGYAAMWAGHNENCNSYFSVYNGTSWSAQKTFAWDSFGCPTSSGKTVTYANIWYMGTDLISFVRSVDTSPNYLISKDNGATWNFGGRLTSTPQVGYVAGYYKFWGNNKDRIDFVATEAHPRDNNNSLYHGYVKDGKVYNSTGTVIDDTLADKTGQEITKYTKLFATGGTVGSVKISNAWNSDLVRYDDGTIGLIWTGRVGSTANGDLNTDLRLLYARFDGTSWKLTYLSKAGPKLYDSEQDYTGLGALAPDDPKTIYISTAYDPNTDTLKSGAKREIWRGTTCDGGATFKWTPVTANSTKDNYRPIVPKWDATHTALLWMRGTYVSAQSMTMSIVGTITGQ